MAKRALESLSESVPWHLVGLFSVDTPPTSTWGHLNHMTRWFGGGVAWSYRSCLAIDAVLKRQCRREDVPKIIEYFKRFFQSNCRQQC